LFDVVVNAESNKPFLQWQVSTNDGATWANLSGATYPVYYISSVAPSMYGNLYRCSARNFNAVMTYSDAARLLEPADTDATLAFVAGEPITSGSQLGSATDPKASSINVSNAVSSIGRNDIMVAETATFRLYSDSSFGMEVTGTDSITLAAGSSTTIYVKVTAEDGTTICHYCVAVSREANPTYSLTVVKGSGSGSYEMGEVVQVKADAAPEGYGFSGWTLIGDGTLADDGAAETTYTMSGSAATITANYASTDIDLESVADQIVVTGGGSGAIDDPLTAEIHVASSLSRIGRADIMVASEASFNLYEDVLFIEEVTGEDTIELSGDSATTVYVKVTAEIGATCYYSVDVVRAETYELTVVNGSGSGSYEAGEVVQVKADAPPPGKVFATWLSSHAGGLSDAGSADTTYTMPASAVTLTAIYADIPSSDIGLVSVAGQAVITDGGSGSMTDPKTAEVSVGAGQASIGLTDIVAAPGASFSLYVDAVFSQEVTGLESIPLPGLSTTTVYIRVTAEDGTTCHYSVAVTTPRAGYDVIYHFGTFAGSGSVAGASTGPVGKFVRLTRLPDGQAVDSRHYAVSDGSTVITLTEAYLKTLPNGEYAFRVEFTDGYTDLVLRVALYSPSTPPGSTTPPTGDSSLSWCLAAVLSAMLGSSSIYRKKRRRRCAHEL
jgi:hypothetical protein